MKATNPSQMKLPNSVTNEEECRFVVIVVVVALSARFFRAGKDRALHKTPLKGSFLNGACSLSCLTLLPFPYNTPCQKGQTHNGDRSL